MSKEGPFYITPQQLDSKVSIRGGPCYSTTDCPSRVNYDTQTQLYANDDAHWYYIDDSYDGVSLMSSFAAPLAS